MPTYAYRCSECDHAFDIYQQFSDDALTVCPECGGKLRKVFGSLGVTFSGSGFYRTDSRSEAQKSSGGEGFGSSSTSAPGTASTPAKASTGTSASSGSGASGGSKS